MSRTLLIKLAYFDHLGRPRRAKWAKFPADSQISGFRDEFAPDCLLQRRVCKPSLPAHLLEPAAIATGQGVWLMRFA